MTDLIGVKNKDHLFPVEWLGKAILKCPSAIGVAACVESELQILRTNDPARISIATINEMQGAFKDELLVMHLCNTAAQILPEDLQPYNILLNEDETPALVAFLSGDFSKYRQANSKYSDAYHCIQDHLKPKIIQLAKLAGGEMEAMWAELIAPMIVREFGSMWTGTGTITLLSDMDVAPVTFNVNPLKREFVYGWVSDGLLDTQQDVPLPTSMVNKAKNLAASLTAKVTGAPGAEVVGKLGPLPEKETETAAAPKIENSSGTWYPPQHLHGKPLKAEYRRMMVELTGVNELPDNWQQRVGIPIPKGKSVKGLDQLPNVVGNKNLETAKTDAARQVSTEFQGVLGPKTIEALEAKFAGDFDYTKKITDASGKPIPEPEVMPAYENKGATAWDQVGLNLESLFKLKRPDYLWLAKNHPEFTGECLMNLVGMKIADIIKENPEAFKPKATEAPSTPAGIQSVPQKTSKKLALG